MSINHKGVYTLPQYPIGEYYCYIIEVGRDGSLPGDGTVRFPSEGTYVYWYQLKSYPSDPSQDNIMFASAGYEFTCKNTDDISVVYARMS